MGAVAVAATLVAAAFSIRCFGAALERRSVAFLVWSFALAQFTVATAALAVGVIAAGWTAGLYRVYYLLGAITNIGWLALGTIWLLARRRTAQWATFFVTLLSTMAVLEVARAALPPSAAAALASEIPRGSLVMPAGARVYSRIFSIGGSAVVVGGLVYSLVRRRDRVRGLGLLALGVVVVAAGGELARYGMVLPFSTSIAAGVAVMYAGFVRADRPVRR